MNVNCQFKTDQPSCSGHCCCDRYVRRGFTITEMLVVVAIIVLLAGLLLVAMGRVRNSALETQTLSTMRNFAAACDAFYLDHGVYPGVIPERVLATQPAELFRAVGPEAPSTGTISFTSTENALLHLMGGYRVLPPNTSNNSSIYIDYNNFEPEGGEVLYEIRFGDWQLKIKPSNFGEGPVIDGKHYAAYYTPGPNEVAVASGQYQTDDQVRIPDLVDAWGQPIIFMRQASTSGVLVGYPTEERAQFYFGTEDTLEYGGMTGYLKSETLGEMMANQILRDGNGRGSILTSANVDKPSTFAQIIRHPAFGPEEEPLHEDNKNRVAARGAYVLISAGSDGIFFSALDGPGTDNIVTGEFANPKIIEEFNDIVIFGGG